MPVTEVALFRAVAGTVTPELTAAAKEALRVQDGWCAANVPELSQGAEARGAAAFVQVDDPAATFMTAHWESVAQHGEWIASPDNQGILGVVAPHLDLTTMEYFHLADMAAITATEEQAPGLTPALRAPVLGVTRIRVAAADKADFTRAYDGVKQVLNDYAKTYVHRGGWKIEKESDDADDEFVVIGGWESLERASSFPESQDYVPYDAALKPFVKAISRKYYHRLL